MEIVMKKLLYLTLLIAAVTGCVDDYTEFNPPAQLDAPHFRVSATGSNQLIEATNVNNWQKTYSAYVLYDDPVTFTVSVVDAPGKVGSVSVTGSVPDFGTITMDEASVNALVGKEQGEFRFTFTPNPDLTNKESEDRALNLVVNVTDMQLDDKGREDPKTTTMTIPTTIGGPCLGAPMLVGNWLVVDASGSLDGVDPFELADLVEAAGSEIVVAITRDRPGVYTLDEVTGGVWPIVYDTRANPKLKVNVCGSTISDREGANVAGAGTAAARTFTLDGTINGDGTITIEWSYVRNDGATPANPASGTYTLKHFNSL